MSNIDYRGMSSNVIEFKRQAGNGAREALIEILEEFKPEAADIVLAELWAKGFKIVPVTSKP